MNGISGIADSTPGQQTYQNPEPMPVAPAEGEMPQANFAPMGPTQARTVAYDPMTAPPTPEELALTAPPTPDELKAVGYNPPSIMKSSDVQGKSPMVLQTLKDMGTAVVGEAGSLGAGLLANAGKILGNDYLKGFSSDQDKFDQQVLQAKSSSPIAAEVAKLGTDVGGALLGGEVGAGVKAIAGAAGGAGILGTLASGASQGALASLATNKSDSAGESAALGAAGGAILMGVGSAVGQGLSAAKTALMGRIVGKAPDEVADKVISSMIGDMSSKEASNITPEDILSNMKSTRDAAKEAMSANYASRDALAAEANDGKGIMVDRSGLSSYIDQLKSIANTSSSPQIDSAMSTAERVLQNGAPVSFKIAQQGVSNLGSEAYEADRLGQSAKSSILMNLKDALEKDIGSASAQNPEVLTAHLNATNFARDTYYPLANAQLDKIALDKASELKFVTGLMKQSLGDGSSAYSTMASQDPQFAGKVIGANINALKDAATRDGEHINLGQFVNSLNKSATNMPAAYADHLEPVRTLANILNATKTAQGGGLSSTLGQGAAGSAGAILGATQGYQHGGLPGAIVGGISGAGAGYELAKTPFLYAAGKMISNDSSMQLLKNAGLMAKSNNPAMTALVNSKVAQLFSNIASKAVIPSVVGGLAPNR